MSADVAYLDTSAVVKLFVEEPETRALRQELKRWPRRASSALLRVELLRAARRAGLPEVVQKARAHINDLFLIQIESAVLDRAANLTPDDLRSLDAIHLASAMSLEMDLGAIVTYDERMSQAGRELGLPVIAPH